MLSQESQNQAPSEQQTAEAAQEAQEEQQTQSQQAEQRATQVTQAAQPRKRRMRKLSAAELTSISPRPSYWPIMLAFAIVVFLYGAVGNDYIMYGGVVLVIVGVIGWSLERR